MLWLSFIFLRRLVLCRRVLSYRVLCCVVLSHGCLVVVVSFCLKHVVLTLTLKL